MEFLIVYLLGAVLYGTAENLWRGWTHWSMLLLGGACFSLMYLISAAPLPFAAKLLFSALGITVLEFLTGCLVNLSLGWQVWDYSALPLNILGQVCPLYSFLWLLLSAPGLLLCSALRRLMPAILSA